MAQPFLYLLLHCTETRRATLSVALLVSVHNKFAGILGNCAFTNYVLAIYEIAEIATTIIPITTG